MAFEERYASLLNKCVGSLTTWKSFINENLDGQYKEIELAKLQEITKEYCILDNNHQKSEKAIALVEETVKDPSKTYSVNTIYKEKLAEQEDEDPKEHEIWKQLFDNDISIREVKPKKQKSNAQYEEVDDSLMCSTSFTAPIDPISKTVIRKPVRNAKCKHVYDSQAIYDYIRQSKSKAKCPYMGCTNNKLVPADLVPDGQLEEQISQFLATQQTQESSEEESD